MARKRQTDKERAHAAFPSDPREDVTWENLPDIFPVERGPGALLAPTLPKAPKRITLSIVLRMIAERTSDATWSAVFAQIADRVGELETNAAMADTHLAVLERYKARLPDLESRLTSLERDLSVACDQRDRARATTSEYVDELGTTRARLKAAEARAEIADILASRVKSLEAKNRQMIQELDVLEGRVGVQDQELAWSEKYDERRVEAELRVFEDAHITMGHGGWTFSTCSRSWCKQAQRLIEDGVAVPSKATAT